MHTSKNPPQRRDYKKEALYEAQPEQVAHRVERNRLHAQAERKAGHPIHEDVAHIKPLDGKGNSNLPGNSRVESVHKNRSWRAGQKGYKVPIDK